MELTEKAAPCFTRRDFPIHENNVYIHMSSEYPDFIGVPHRHEYIEIVYIISGRAVHETDGRRIHARRGDLFIVNPGCVHAFYSEPDPAEPFCTYDLMLTPDFFDASLLSGGDLNSLGSSFLFYSIFPEERVSGPDLRLTGGSYSDFGSLFNRIYLEYYGRGLRRRAYHKDIPTDGRERGD